MEGGRYFFQISRFTLLERFSKNTQISNFTNICAMGAEFSYEHGRTDKHDKANNRFSQFCERAYKPTYRYGTFVFP
jgi:hypothetical protein